MHGINTRLHGGLPSGGFCEAVSPIRNGKVCVRSSLHIHRKANRRGLTRARSNEEGSPGGEQPMKDAVSEAIQERIRKAKEYKKGQSSMSSVGSEQMKSKDEREEEKENEKENEKGRMRVDPSSIAPAGFLDIQAPKDTRAEENNPVITPSRVAPEPERPEFSDRRLSQEDFQAKIGTSGSGLESAFRAGDVSEEDKAAAFEKEQIKKRTGSTAEAAGFLKELFTEEREQELEKTKEKREGMRPEEFSVIQDKKMKSRGADVISVDKSYSPKVSTWGMFPRPDNISEAYGGGKTIDPTKPLEEDDVKEKRDRAVVEKLQSYRQQVGLEVDPEVEKKFNAVYGAGMQIFKAGELKAAYKKFDEASKIVDWGTKLGGDADYYKAMCLDSLGQNMEAKPMYKRLTQHPHPDVRKLSKRMLFGFSAMDNLKTHTISYKVGNAYEKYFRNIKSDYDTVYFGDEDDMEDSLVPLLFLLGMILMPLSIIFVFTQM